MNEYEENIEDVQDQPNIGMRFCSECNNMLYPKENKTLKKLQYVCRRCTNVEDADTNCVYRNDIKASNDISLYNIEWEALVHDPTLPRTGNLQCDRCPNKEVVLLQTGFGLSSTGSGTSGGMNLWFVCTNCFYRWSNTNK